jgi:hypothetical protein
MATAPLPYAKSITVSTSTINDLDEYKISQYYDLNLVSMQEKLVSGLEAIKTKAEETIQTSRLASNAVTETKVANQSISIQKIKSGVLQDINIDISGGTTSGLTSTFSTISLVPQEDGSIIAISTNGSGAPALMSDNINTSNKCKIGNSIKIRFNSKYTNSGGKFRADVFRGDTFATVSSIVTTDLTASYNVYEITLNCTVNVPDGVACYLVLRLNPIVQGQGFQYKEALWMWSDAGNFPVKLNEKISDIESDIVALHKPEKTYANITDATQTNLNTYSYVKNGSATVVGSVATVTGAYGGIVSNEFVGTKFLKIVVSGTFTTPNAMIMLSYYNGSAWTNETKFNGITDGILNHTITIDTNNYFVYKNAQKYKILVLMESGTVGGTITITDMTINDLDEFRISDYYDSNMLNMQKKIVSGVQTSVSKLNGLETKKSILTSPNGTRYFLNVNNSGALTATPVIPNKSLFMMNSLGFGIDVENLKGGHFGMMASDHTKDFKYLVQQSILAKNPSATFTDKSIALFEQAETTTASQTQINSVITACTSDLDLIICQIGDNVSNSIRSSVFATKFKDFVSAIKTASPNARIIFVGCWFNANYSRSTIIQGAKDFGCEFVDITSRNERYAQSVAGSTFTYKDGTTGTVLAGWESHPGDIGQFNIFTDIINTVGI